MIFQFNGDFGNFCGSSDGDSWRPVDYFVYFPKIQKKKGKEGKGIEGKEPAVEVSYKFGRFPEISPNS